MAFDKNLNLKNMLYIYVTHIHLKHILYMNQNTECLLVKINQKFKI